MFESPLAIPSTVRVYIDRLFVSFLPPFLFCFGDTAVLETHGGIAVFFVLLGDDRNPAKAFLEEVTGKESLAMVFHGWRRLLL